MPRVFYRIVKSERPTRDGFLSHALKGLKPRNPTPKSLHEYNGVSVLDTAQHARAWAERLPYLGEYIAELHIPDDVLIVFEGPNPRGHGNLYETSPDELLRYVQAIYHFTDVPIP
ncbi:MAG: hypothetical protein H0V51_19975 [Chloroflexi bacterium]|nr:hypothetical protein [Chloroflexota bacterium]